MTSGLTHMRREIEEIPEATRRLLDGSAARFADAGAALRRLDPVMIATIARGSSDHATAFLKYAIEISAGIPVASIGPSITSIYGRELRLKGCAALSISQSGGSPDIVAMTRSAKKTGALTIALTNTPDSPLGRAADVTIDLLAGRELSVAATKSFISSIVAGLAILANWTEDSALRTRPRRCLMSLRNRWRSIGRRCLGRSRVGARSTFSAAGRPLRWRRRQR